ncbi:hypothetical protein GTY65_07880 [Streptomyces sp. SID8379]|uniref:anti-sigma factor family protein n=1 Tax=unclassified Streptomyces TaxID=2593676 RepID=UPI00037C3BAA|nr:hypothetical protein [Streptomyces sp. HmicA12]MYW63989.1 hypothetical protein [Streptomyces sp. SID8379]
MTSTTDTAEHPEVTEISDLAEGLLPPSRTSDIRRHLDDCVLCADVYSSLEEIRGMLGTLPDVPRMPEDIAARIDASLAAEALLDTASYEDREDRGRETVPVSRETSAEPSAPSPRPSDRPAGRAHSATGPGRKPRTARRRAGAAIGAVLTVAAIGAGTLFLQSGDGTSTAGHTPASASGTTSSFAKGTLETKVSELLRTETTSLGTEGTGPRTPTVPALPKRAKTPPPCIQLGTHRSESPLGFKKGTYEGKDAYLVVLPHKTDPDHQVTAFIVDASCTSQASVTTGKLLYTHSYKRA